MTVVRAMLVTGDDRNNHQNWLHQKLLRRAFSPPKLRCGSKYGMKKNNLTRRHFAKSLALALPLIAGGGGLLTGRARAQDKKGDFVTVNNGRFELHGRPFSYIGAN